jgi:hypothetical protein
MKKLIIPFLLVMALVFQSCEETQSPIYDGSQTLAYFDGTSATLEVEINSTGEITIPVNVSTLSDTDRTVTVSVNEGATTATAGQYSFNSAVTIPANTYFSSFTLTGIDDGLTTDGTTLTLQIDGVDGGVGSSRGYSVNIVEICPIDASFAVGDYTLDTTSGGVPAAGFAPAMGNGVTVTLAAGSSSTERIFNVKFYPTFGFANPPVDVAFTLVCESTVFGGIVEPGVSGVGCGSSIPFGASSTNGTYNTADDSVITLFYLEDVEGASCGTEAEGSVRLTKQ